jgi:N-carbamoylputrescine amidase
MTASADQHSQTVTVAAIQLNCNDNAVENTDRAIEQIKLAAAKGARLICLQELFTSPYFCQSEDHDQFARAESIPGSTTDRLCQVAQEQSVVIVAGLFERRAAGLFHNTAVVIERDGSIAGVYRKMHIPDDPYFYEKFYFTPGDTGFQAPEKAQFGDSQRNAWQTMMRSHAIANGIYVIAPNRVGTEDHIEFWGSSFVADPYGNLMCVAGEQPETLIAKCDLNLIETARTHWPFLRDRRIDAYQGLTKRFLDSKD